MGGRLEISDCPTFAIKIKAGGEQEPFYLQSTRSIVHIADYTCAIDINLLPFSLFRKGLFRIMLYPFTERPVTYYALPPFTERACPALDTGGNEGDFASSDSQSALSGISSIPNSGEGRTQGFAPTSPALDYRLLTLSASGSLRPPANPVNPGDTPGSPRQENHPGLSATPIEEGNYFTFFLSPFPLSLLPLWLRGIQGSSVPDPDRESLRLQLRASANLEFAPTSHFPPPDAPTCSLINSLSLTITH